MQLTLLELTQNILSALDSDEVNSISDTTEARQVVKVIKTAYFNILSRANLPEHQNLFTLDASGSSDLPVLMTKPTNVARIDWIQYNKLDDDANDLWIDIPIYPLKTFIDITQQLDPTATNVGSMEVDTHTFYFEDDTFPTKCTILNDFNIIFDAYDNTIETTLQTEKTKAFGLLVPTFEESNNFVPDMDELQSTLLLNEAKSLAFFELKQVTHEKAELEARRQWRSLQRNKSLSVTPTHFDALPNFGRK